MKTAIITTTVDPASMNIRENLLADFDFEKLDIDFDGFKVYESKDIRLYTTDRMMITYENIDEALPQKPDLVIFASKHKSASGIASLTVHPIGNWGIAELGGKDNTLCIAPAKYIQFAMSTIKEIAKKEKLSGFDLVREVTHHGPYLKTSCMFIEIGSEEKGWVNHVAGKVIAKTIMHILTNPLPEYEKICFGIGGTHYAQEFTKRAEFSNWAFGHIMPKHALDHLSNENVLAALRDTKDGGAKKVTVVVDWKGVGPHKDKIRKILQELNIIYELA